MFGFLKTVRKSLTVDQVLGEMNQKIEQLESISKTNADYAVEMTAVAEDIQRQANKALDESKRATLVADRFKALIGAA